MRVFGSKRVEPTDEDLAALARLSAVAARFKPAEAVDADGTHPPAAAEHGPHADSGE